MVLTRRWPLVALLVLGHLLVIQVCQAITEPSEVSALLAMKAAWGNPASLSVWNSSSDPCEQNWRGILCTPVSQGGNRRITGIQLPGNNFNGTLSSSVGVLTSLTLLDLNGNLLTGAMPTEVGNLKSLQRFVIHGNGFTGLLDPWLPKLTNLRIADFSLNHFSGPVPDSIGKVLNTLQNLDCSSCSLSGPIPASLGLLSSLQMLGLGGNNLTGRIPPELGSIGGLQALNLQNNSLSGPVPSELASLTNLNMLILAFNNLTGPVPASIISNAAVLTRLDGNPLCSLPENAPVCTGPGLPPLGAIPGAPPGFGGPDQPGASPGGGPVNATASAPVNFRASAPSPVASTGASTALAPVPSSSSGGGNQSEPANAAVTTSTALNNALNPALTTDSGSSFPLGATIGIILGAAALAALCIFFALLLVFRRRQESDAAASLNGKALLGSTSTGHGAPPTPTSGSDTWSEKLFSVAIGPGSLADSSPHTSGDHGRPEPSDLVAPLLFTFRELQKLTDGFDPARQVGEGGFGKVYWARSKGNDVAIKRLDKDAAMSAKYGEKQFRTEVDVLSRIRHPHLLALIGYCADGGERALVYPLMQNHSLFDQLHRVSEPCPALATWRKRLTIAAQAASALAYLHDEASPPVIHRDFTSSNVLLDGGWTAVVSDFGLAKLLSKPGSHSMVQSTRLHGTLGYLAPEYLRGHVTEKNDVYSFGVVLLELLSGRRAAVSEEFDLVQWAADVIDGPPPALPKLLDPAVKDNAPEELLAAAVRVARACVDTDPKRRPRMNEVYTSLTVAIEAAYGEDSALIVSKPLAVARPAPEAHAVVNIPEAESI